MADLTITTTAVKRVNGPVEDGIAGEAIARGKVCYLTSSGTWKLAQCDGAAIEAGEGTRLGIALNDAATDQPIKLQRGGDIDLGAAAPASGVTYVVAAAAGSIAVDADILTPKYKAIVGVGRGSNILRLAFVTGGAI